MYGLWLLSSGCGGLEFEGLREGSGPKALGGTPDCGRIE